MYLTHVSSSMMSFVSHLGKKLQIDDVAEELGGHLSKFVSLNIL